MTARSVDCANQVKVAVEAFDHQLTIPVDINRVYSDPEKLLPERVEITIYPLTRNKERAGQTVTETIELDCLIQRKLKPTDTDGNRFDAGSCGTSGLPP